MRLAILMILTVKPKGRGNWAACVMAIEGRHMSPLSMRVGQCFELGGVWWRICGVMP